MYACYVYFLNKKRNQINTYLDRILNFVEVSCRHAAADFEALDGSDKHHERIRCSRIADRCSLPTYRNRRCGRKRTCGVVSALEVHFFKVMRSINLRFTYLLTYL